MFEILNRYMFVPLKKPRKLRTCMCCLCEFLCRHIDIRLQFVIFDDLLMCFCWVLILGVGSFRYVS